MNSTDLADRLAVQFFDSQIVPLAQRRLSLGAPGYFPLAPDAEADSYFVPAPAVVDFDFPGNGNAEGLIAALEAIWRARGEADLMALMPGLSAIADALRAEPVDESGDVSVLCYTMF
jgi:hypothetical protein